MGPCVSRECLHGHVRHGYQIRPKVKVERHIMGPRLSMCRRHQSALLGPRPGRPLLRLPRLRHVPLPDPPQLARILVRPGVFGAAAGAVPPEPPPAGILRRPLVRAGKVVLEPLEGGCEVEPGPGRVGPPVGRGVEQQQPAGGCDGEGEGGRGRQRQAAQVVGGEGEQRGEGVARRVETLG